MRRTKVVAISVVLLLLCFLAGAVVYLAAQSGFGQAYVWVWTGSTWRHRPLTGSAVTITPTGVEINAAPSKEYRFNAGFWTVQIAGTNQVEVNLDSTYVLYRVIPPALPGPCSIGGAALGQGLLAVGADGYAYFCIPAASETGAQSTYIWARTPLETTW